MKHRTSSLFLALVASAILVTGVAAKGPPLPGEETTNNLSVPAIFVPSVGVGTPTCTVDDDTVYLDPLEMSVAFPGYYIQGEATWQADCGTAAIDTVTATAAWGDNLTSAPLKQRTPIRVEMGLMADALTYQMTGFSVVKLTDELDRLATYGTDGVPVSPFGEVRVWNAGAQLKISNDAGVVVYDGPYTAEINSTGRVVYGYNWQKPVAGTYTIAFYAPEFQHGVREAFERCVRDGAPFDMELQIVTAMGRRLWVRAVGQANGRLRLPGQRDHRLRDLPCHDPRARAGRLGLRVRSLPAPLPGS